MPHKKLLGLLILAAAPIAGADVLLVDSVEMNTATGSRPSSGMTMSRVEADFGTPASRLAAVGDPPITRWEYPNFTVYFEHDRVIHAVARR